MHYTFVWAVLLPVFKDRFGMNCSMKSSPLLSIQPFCHFEHCLYVSGSRSEIRLTLAPVSSLSDTVTPFISRHCHRLDTVLFTMFSSFTYTATTDWTDWMKRLIIHVSLYSILGLQWKLCMQTSSCAWSIFSLQMSVQLLTSSDWTRNILYHDTVYCKSHDPFKL